MRKEIPVILVSRVVDPKKNNRKEMEGREVIYYFNCWARMLFRPQP
jgi:hypothetical protein